MSDSQGQILEFRKDWLRTLTATASTLLLINLMALTVLFSIDVIVSWQRLIIGVVIIISSLLFVVSIFQFMGALGSLVLEVGGREELREKVREKADKGRRLFKGGIVSVMGAIILLVVFASGIDEIIVRTIAY